MSDLYDGNRRRAIDKEEFSSCPRYDKHELSDDQIEDIAERAATRAVSKVKGEFYEEVGKGVMSKLYWLVGIILVGAYAWMVAHGFIKGP